MVTQDEYAKFQKNYDKEHPLNEDGTPAYVTDEEYAQFQDNYDKAARAQKAEKDAQEMREFMKSRKGYARTQAEWDRAHPLKEDGSRDYVTDEEYAQFQDNYDRAAKAQRAKKAAQERGEPHSTRSSGRSSHRVAIGEEYLGGIDWYRVNKKDREKAQIEKARGGRDITWSELDALDELSYKIFPKRYVTAKDLDEYMAKFHTVKYDPKTGKYTEYTAAGKVFKTGKLKDGKKDGQWKFFDEDGRLHIQCSYVKGQQIGPYKEYYSATGKLREEYISIGNGKYVGWHNTYDEMGWTEDSRFWEGGKFEGRLERDEGEVKEIVRQELKAAIEKLEGKSAEPPKKEKSASPLKKKLEKCAQDGKKQKSSKGAKDNSDQKTLSFTSRWPKQSVRE